MDLRAEIKQLEDEIASIGMEMNEWHRELVHRGCDIDLPQWEAFQPKLQQVSALAKQARELKIKLYQQSG